MKHRTFFFAFILILLSSFVWAENEVSDYCLEKVNEFVTLRVQLKSIKDDEEVLRIIDGLRTEAMEKLQETAKDLEQEKQILSNLYFMESYEHMFTKDNRAQLRKLMKKQMSDSHKIMDKRKESQLNKWFYVSTADVTSYYMTRSIAASFFYGFKVKDWYKKAVEKDNLMTAANACLGNWNFYAPAPIGSNKKALQYYKNSVKGAVTDGEKYMAYTYYSQFLYEQKKKTEAAEYLQMAYDLNLGTKELDLMKKCNDEGISYLQYLRNRSGIDEEMTEGEKEAEDK